jgi:dTDP-4-dehydrorhamnose reductase
MTGIAGDRLLVLGADGMLGHKMFQRLRARFPGTRGTLRTERSDSRFAGVPLLQSEAIVERVDVMDEGGLRRTIESLRPAVVVNCVGVIKQRDAAHDAIPSITINALLPHRLAAWLAPWQGRLIHFSTDCVFSGRRGGYREDDPSDAEDLYGKSKYLGEVRDAPNALTLRTSIIGRELHHHRSLLDWFLQQSGTVRGFTKVIYSGVTTNHLADLVGDVIERHGSLCGLYQVASAPISKHDLLLLVKDAFKVDVTIVPDDREVSDRSLDGSRFAAATGYVCPTWPTLVAELAADPTPYASIAGRMHAGG